MNFGLVDIRFTVAMPYAIAAQLSDLPVIIDVVHKKKNYATNTQLFKAKLLYLNKVFSF